MWCLQRNLFSSCVVQALCADWLSSCPSVVLAYLKVGASSVSWVIRVAFTAADSTVVLPPVLAFARSWSQIPLGCNTVIARLPPNDSIDCLWESFNSTDCLFDFLIMYLFRIFINPLCGSLAAIAVVLIGRFTINTEQSVSASATLTPSVFRDGVGMGLLVLHCSVSLRFNANSWAYWKRQIRLVFVFC